MKYLMKIIKPLFLLILIEFRLGFRHAYENYRDQADWFVKVRYKNQSFRYQLVISRVQTILRFQNKPTIFAI